MAVNLTKIVELLLLLLLLLVGPFDGVLASDRLRRNNNNNNNFAFDDAPIQTEYVDRSNLDRVLAMFNLTEAQMKRISPGLSTASKATSTTDNSSTQYFHNAKEYR